MKISLVIPTYNEEQYIKKCLISAFDQEEKFYEVIIVNNNSTDKTLSIAKQFPVRIVHESRQGMIQARNCGFNAVEGDIIARCDADAHLPSDWSKLIREDFTNFPIDALTGPCKFYDLKLKTNLFSKIYLDAMKPILNGNEVLLGPNMVLKKEMWKKVRETVCTDNKRVHEDIDLAIHITHMGGKIMRDNNLVVAISGRRIKYSPASFFGEYPLRVIRTLAYHSKDILTPFLPL